MAKYDWKKTLKKFLYGCGYLVICGLLYIATDRPEVVAFVPILIGAQNYLKHGLGWEWL